MLSDLRANLKVFQEDYNRQLTEEERVSLCEIMDAVDRLEREYHEKLRKQAHREIQNLFLREKVTPEEVFVALEACGVTVVQPNPCEPDRRWWEFWK